MNASDIAKLAVAGMLTASLATTPLVGGEPEKAADAKYSEVHDCAGLNVCKGLGGCKVTEEKLAKLAKKLVFPGKSWQCS